MLNYASPRNRQLHEPKSLKGFIVVGMLALVACLAVVNIVLSAHLSDLGLRLQTLGQQAEALQSKNQLLEQAILANSALTTLEARADQIGFGREYQALVYPLSEPVAYQPF